MGRNRIEKLTGSEFLSGMAKDEKLNPVTTIVFYHGEDPYDGCTNLHDMLEFNKENKTFKRFVADYHINLFKAEDLDENMFETGLHELIGFLKHRNDKQGLINFIEQDKERIQNMDEATLDVVSVMLSIPAFITKGEDKMEGEEHNLCKALTEWLADEREAGIKEGERKGREEGETRFASLTSALLTANRISDLTKAASDAVFRESLYREFAL